jgi:hypothetical protein
MPITTEERFALGLLFRESDVTSVAVRIQLDMAEVIERKATGVGFFTTIRLITPLPVTTKRQWDWNFAHSQLSHGGSFICWIDGTNVLELEAVVNDGAWPNDFDPRNFKEI